MENENIQKEKKEIQTLFQKIQDLNLSEFPKLLVTNLIDLYQKAIKIMEEDREKAINNYNMFLNILENGDDRDATKENLNRALEIVLESSKRLKEVITNISNIVIEIIKFTRDNKEKNFRENFFNKK